MSSDDEDQECVPLEVEYDDAVLDSLESGLIDEDSSSIKPDSCCYFLGSDKLDFDKRLVSYMKNVDLKMSAGCLVNTVTNLCNAVLSCRSFDIGQCSTYAIIDAFLRERHELLHGLSMSCLSLDSQVTDQKFSDVFPGFPSDKTPDRIIRKQDRVLIIETTATLNVLKSHIAKGKIEEGFKSKYESEINRLRDDGFDVDYIVLSFDVKNPVNDSYNNDLIKASEILDVSLKIDYKTKLEMVRLVFCNFSTEIVKKFSREVTNLLSENFVIQKPSLPIDFLIKDGPSKLNGYKRIAVSTFVYNKILNAWPRFAMMLERSMQDFDGLVSPILEHSTNKFYFDKDRSGVKYDTLMEIIIMEDKPAFCKLLIQLFDGRPFKSDRADVEFFNVSKTSHVYDHEDSDFNQVKHLNSSEWFKKSELDDYSSFVQVDYYLTKHHAFEDCNYEDKLKAELQDFYKSIKTEEDFNNYCKNLTKKPFSFFELNEETVDTSIQNFNKEMHKLNTNQDNKPVIRYQKQPFLLPLIDCYEVDYISYKDRPNAALKAFEMAPKLEYTRQIFNAISRDEFVWGSRQEGENADVSEILFKIRNANSKIYKLQIEQMKRLSLLKIPKLKEIEGSEGLRTEVSELNKQLSYLKGSSTGKLSIVRIRCKGKSRFKQHFNEEMSHFKSKKSSSFYKGVGFIDSLMLETDFNNLKFSLLSSNGKACPENIMDTFVSDDVTLLKQLKMDYVSSSIAKLNHLKSTQLYHSCAFVSRFCHSLAFHSQSSLGCDYVAVDNLGYDKVILLVRGGKKIFKTKKSKLFRLLYPVHSCIKHWYTSPNFTTSTSTFEYNGSTYCLTPWHAIDEVILNDGLTFLHRCMSYVLLCHEPDISLSLDKCFFNVVLSFHARRKTEELLHNLRYVCVNSISNVSRLDLMFPELAGFNYDFFQCFIRSCLSKNFKEFSMKLIKYNTLEKAPKDYFKTVGLKNLFDSSSIENLEDLTMTIYSTFLMSKSPTNQQLEQAKNLTNMLKTWKTHKEQSTDDINRMYEINNFQMDRPGGLTNYWNNLFLSDFNYDSKFVVTLGKFSADYMNSILDSAELNSKWISIVNRNWDEFANTRGLRGMEDDKFFNRKGYYIVYNELLKEDRFVSKVKDLLLSDMDEYKKRKMLKGMNKLYKEKLGCKDMKEAIFHVVDKKQRGGSREIFVMDLETKINQQAIEKLLSFMCSKIPNEAISVPSNRRLQHIHANVFEKFQRGEGEVFNLTLDCRKWAPHSIINKFIDMILSMSGYLPESFITHFIIFFSKMFKKKVYTRKGIYQILSSNEGNKGYMDAFKEDTGKTGYYMEMSYSWVMGIFNYMSSFMHVMNQIYASHIIMNVTMNSNGEYCQYHMNAHSDDSGGKMHVDSKLSMKKTFFIYELLLKSCNHLLSDKKCNISKRYFEFLSVLYISDQLLSLISKISGSFNFHPTDTGYCGDINECYGKCIEMISSGATFDVAYLSMKISSHLVYKFYFNTDPVPTDYQLPPQLLGIPDCHPIMAMIAGSDADIIRLTNNDEKQFDKFIFLSNILNKNKELNMDLIKPIIATPFIRKTSELMDHVDLIGVDDLDEDLQWVIKNFDSKNSALQLMKYGLLLKDQKFVSALIDETITRRISRAYFFRTSKVCSTPWGLMTYKGMKVALKMFNSDIPLENFTPELVEPIIEVKKDFQEFLKTESKFNLYEVMNFEIYAFLKSINDISYQESDIIPNFKTCKPMHINMQKTNLPTSGNFNPATLCVWICFPKYRWMINLGDDYMNKYLQLENYLNRHGLEIGSMEPNWLYNLLQKMKSKYVKEYFIYSNVPHDVRDISNYKDFLTFLAHNSFKGKVVNGITIPLGERITNPMSLIFQNQFNDELLKVLTFINYCFSVIVDFKLFTEVLTLELNSDYLGCKSRRLYPLLVELEAKWEMDSDNHHLIVPHLKCLIAHMNNELYGAPWLENSCYYSFVKSQKLVGNVWLGKGILFINTPDLRLELHLSSNKIDKIITNKNKLVLKVQTIVYINSVLLNANLPKLEDTFEKMNLYNWEKYSIGLNSNGLICIDQCRNLKLCHPNFQHKHTIINSATNPGICKVGINKNFSYTFTNKNEIFGDQSSVINVLKVSPSETFNVLRKLYDNDVNRSIIDMRGEDFNKYFKMFIGLVSDIDLSITSDQLFDMYRSTKAYSILSEMAKSEELTQSMMLPRKHIFPGQPGGLLHVLLKYKEVHPEFAFNPDLVLSPEMMSLKSSQPESFISNLITNIGQKYSNLYSGTDKVSIKNEIFKISNIIDSDEYKSRLLSLLTTWGYIGVMGALDEVTFIKKVENFKSIRNYCDNSQYAGLNLMIFKKVVTSILNVAKKINYFNTLIENTPPLIAKSYEDLIKTLISFVHTRVLSSYNSNLKTLTYMPDLEFLKLYNSLKLLFEVDNFDIEVQNELADHPMLSLIPIDRKNLRSVMIMIETAINSVVMNKKQSVKLNFEKKMQHDHDLVQPYVTTKTILDETPAKYNMKAAIHHGVLSNDAYNDLNKHRLIKVDGKYFDVSLSPGSFSDLSLPFSKFFYLENRLKSSIDEDSDDYYDISIEMNSTEPDVETLTDMLDNVLAADYCRTSRVRDKGFLIRSQRIDAKYFLIPHLKGNMGLLSNVRNSATTIVLVTTCYIEDIIEFQTDKIQIFHCINAQWKNRTLVDPECLLYYVLDSRKVDIKVWERFLNAKNIDKNELTSIKNRSPTNFIINEKGDLTHTDKYITLEEKHRMINEYDKVEVIEDEPISNESKKVYKMFQDDRLNDLVDLGFDRDFCEVMKGFVKKVDVEPELFFQRMIERFMNSKQLAEIMKNKTKSNIGDSLQNLSDVNKATKIFEVASVFSVGAPSKTDVKNKSLSDKLLRAEINGLSNKVIDYILSGRLAISKKYKSTFIKHCRAMKRWALTERKDTEKKLFLIDLATLILNDAYDDDEHNHDEMFKEIADLLTEKIVTEDDSEDYVFLNTYMKEANMGRLYYGWDQRG